MTFFESLLILLLAAVVFMQLASAIGLPYPSMLVLAGVAVAFIPGAPTIIFEPATALALFIAPALVDAAFDYPLGTARRFWVPIVGFAIVPIVVTTAVVAYLGTTYAQLPLAVAVALGAIVAPPDAAAATAILGTISIPRNTDSVLKGESLFNDATALLIFGAAVAVQSNGGMDLGVSLGVLLAVPGGIGFGWLAAKFTRRITPLVHGTLRGSLTQFIIAFSVWVLAEHLRLSAVLATVTFAMTLARTAGPSARARVHSYAVWSTVVFVLNVFAFLLMGMQARTIVVHMATERLRDALAFATLVVMAVIVVRLIVVMAFSRILAHRARRRGVVPQSSWRNGVFIGWCGMRGLITLATAFALPASFPKRDLVVLTAFAVVFGTLVLQGITLLPLLRWLKLDQSDQYEAEFRQARSRLLNAALTALKSESGEEAERLRRLLDGKLAALSHPEKSSGIEARRRLRLAAVAAQRAELEQMRSSYLISVGCYEQIQEELDWQELTLLPESERRIEQA